MTEKSTIDLLNRIKGINLSLASDTYSCYDAFDVNYIVEIKNRRKYYSDKIIEAMKLFTNYQESQIKGKTFLYVVTDKKGVWVFNISKNIASIVETPVKAFRCPKTTDFENNSKINKYSYILPESMAKHIEYES
jgi:hypothetical protein